MAHSIRSVPVFALLLPLVACQSTPPKDASAEQAKQRDDGAIELHDASVVLAQLQAMPDAIPVSVRRDARCVAIIPTVMKAAFVVGGRWGRGVASCRTGASWSSPAFFDIGGASVGFQIGVESTDLVIYVMNDDGMRKLLNNRVELGAEASVAAGPVGREASAGTDWKLRAELLTYSRSRGLFAGVNLGGAVLTQDRARTEAFYGKSEDYRMLLEGHVDAPPAAKELLQALARGDAPGVVSAR